MTDSQDGNLSVQARSGIAGASSGITVLFVILFLQEIPLPILLIVAFSVGYTVGGLFQKMYLNFSRRKLESADILKNSE